MFAQVAAHTITIRLQTLMCLYGRCLSDAVKMSDNFKYICRVQTQILTCISQGTHQYVFHTVRIHACWWAECWGFPPAITCNASWRVFTLPNPHAAASHYTRVQWLLFASCCYSLGGYSLPAWLQCQLNTVTQMRLPLHEAFFDQFTAARWDDSGQVCASAFKVTFTSHILFKNISTH